MAGICGWIRSQPQQDPAAVLNRMQEVLPPMGIGSPSHLTPASGLYAKGNSKDLTDLTHDGIYAAVCGTLHWADSELKELASSKGPATALSHAYKKYASNLFVHLHGHYAIAVLEPSTDTLMLAIDRIGAQPLYYSVIDSGGLVFGSSADAVRSHPDIGTKLDAQGLYDYVYFHMVPSPGTVFHGIKKMEPSQVLLFRQGKVELQRYWQPSFSEQGSDSFSDLKSEFNNTLKNSIERCTNASQVGSFLSGGIDSSTVSGVLANLQDKPTRAYSIGFSAEGYDEMEYARIAAQHFNLKHVEYYVTPEDVADAIPMIARAYDEPFGNSSAIPAYFCARLAKKNGTDTLLAGDGGDEIFAGNERYATQKLFNIYNMMPKWLHNGLFEPLFLDLSVTQKIPMLRKVRRYIEQAKIPMPDRMETYNLLDRMTPHAVFDTGFLEGIDTQHPINSLRDTYNQQKSASLVNRMLYLDWKITLADNDLRKVNRMCEIADVEVAYPLLDDELIEFANRVPPSLKLKGFRLRYFVKQALKDFLPSEIITKSKHGFGLPFGVWLLSSPVLQELIYENLRSLKRRGFIRPQYIDQLLDSHRTEHAAYYGTMVWVLAMLEQWFKEHDLSL